MKRYIIPALAAAAVALTWLFLWADNTGVLVYSEPSAYAPYLRSCHYLIGTSIVTPYGMTEGPQRCPLLRRV